MASFIQEKFEMLPTGWAARTADHAIQLDVLSPFYGLSPAPGPRTKKSIGRDTPSDSGSRIWGVRWARVALTLMFASGGVYAQDAVANWFPAHVGDKWTYEHTTRDE